MDNSNQMKGGSFGGGSLNRTYGSGYGYGDRSGGLVEGSKNSRKELQFLVGEIIRSCQGSCSLL